MTDMATSNITLIPSDDFVSMPWRNGQGTTIELLKHHEPGDEHFAWRLSMATVAGDGPFSNFVGYDRTLVLLDGKGITLSHGQSTEVLDQPLQMASFDGGEVTRATLHDGPITDFNIMARSGVFRAETTSNVGSDAVKLAAEADCLAIFAPGAGIEVLIDSDIFKIPSGSLLQVRQPSSKLVEVQGAAFIAVEFFRMVEAQSHGTSKTTQVER